MDIFWECVLEGSTGGLWYTEESDKQDKQLSKFSSDRILIFVFPCIIIYGFY